MRKANTLLNPLAPVLHIPAPIYTHLKQVTQSWAASPVSFWGRWQRVRPEWPENPFHPRFLATFAILLFGISASILGLAGVLSGPQALVPVAMQSTPQDPLALEGRSDDAVRGLFGAPTLIRHEPPAEIWQYRSATCVLDVFLYFSTEAGQTNDGLVRHAELRPRHDITPNASFEADCLRSLRANAQH